MWYKAVIKEGNETERFIQFGCQTVTTCSCCGTWEYDLCW